MGTNGKDRLGYYCYKCDCWWPDVEPDDKCPQCDYPKGSND